MARTITALFDTKADADAGAERLRQADVGASHVSVHDQTTHSTSGDYSTAKDQGLWASVKHAFLPKEDRHAYEEGIRRGGFLLTADVSDDQAGPAVKALEEANSVDLDARSAEWRESGWNYGAADYDDEDDGFVYGTRDTTTASSRYRSYSTGDVNGDLR